MLTLLLAFQAAAAQPPAPPRSEVASLVARAKAARYQQDSALARYEAIAKQRWSASIGLARNLGLGPLGPERLAARFESAVRIGWDHERGGVRRTARGAVGCPDRRRSAARMVG